MARSNSKPDNSPSLPACPSIPAEHGLQETHATMASEDTTDPRVEKRARTIRRFGYLVYGLSGLFIVVTLSIAVINGLSDGTARDPFTGRLADEESAQCVDLAAHLESELETLDEQAKDHPDSKLWHTRFLAWQARCERIRDPQIERLLELGESRHPPISR